MNDNPYAFPNPAYGNGVFRRRIQLQQQGNQVVGLLEDCSHGFEVHISHDGSRLIDVTGVTHRYPLTTCPGATEPLRDLIGIAITASARNINEQVNPRINCTHLYDLAVLAIIHASGTEALITYDVEVPDEINGSNEAKVFRNGELVHHWQTANNQIISPTELAGNTLFQGFAAWANHVFSGAALEAAFVLQKGFFVSQAQKFDHRRSEGMQVGSFSMPLGVCYSYTEARVGQARLMVNRARDFTHTPAQLLTFT